MTNTLRITQAEPRSLLHQPHFRLMFAAAAASKIGMQVSYLAVPLVAVLALQASPGRVGLLATLSTAAFLLIGLPAGALIDRVRRRGVMIAADIARAAVFASIPIAWWMDALTLGQLYVVVFLGGVATVFFDVANLSYLPHVVGRNRLVDANSALHSFDAVINIAGRSGAGYLVQLVTAPVEMAVTATGYLVSGGFLAAIRRREPKPTPTPGRKLSRQITEGLRFVVAHQVLRPIALAGATTNFGMQITITMLPVLFVAELGLPEGALGLFFAAGGCGALLGALTARRLGQWLGQGRVVWILGLAVAPAGFLIPFLDRGPWLVLSGVGWRLVAYKAGVDNVLLVSFRQRVTPDRLLGRQNATMRFLLTGALALGAALAGLTGQVAGVRAALWLGAAFLALVWVPLFLSPMRRVRDLPTATPDSPRNGHRPGSGVGAGVDQRFHEATNDRHRHRNRRAHPRVPPRDPRRHPRQRRRRPPPRHRAPRPAHTR